MKSRHTRQKEELQEIISEFKEFFSADDVLERTSIGKATVYRFLKNAVKEKNLAPYSCGGKTIYSHTQKVHSHFICEETNKTIHFTVDNLNFLKGKVPGEIRSIQIEVRGTCKKCS